MSVVVVEANNLLQVEDEGFALRMGKSLLDKVVGL